MTAERRFLLERVARATQATQRTISEQAHLLGMNTDRFRELRKEARAAGFRVEEEREVNRSGLASSKGQRILAQMQGPGCPVDGCRGPHKCTKGRIQDFARSGEAATG